MIKTHEALGLLRAIAEGATTDDGEVSKDLLYDVFFEYMKQFEEES